MDAPPGFDKLTSSDYNISITDALKSSARTWRYQGFNYTQRDAMNRIQGSVLSNGTLTPFQDGIGWEGVWTIPVCDIGGHIQWNTQFGDKKEGYGRLPCCCGPNCSDTAAFVEAGGWKGFNGLLSGCKLQLANSDIDFSNVDYGFKSSGGGGVSLSFGLKWESWGKGKRFGVVMGFIMAAGLAFSLLGCCGCACG